MVKTFSRVILCSTNDFPDHKNDKIKGWVEHHGGKFTRDLTTDVTHLVTSLRAWKRYLPIVKEARRQRSIKIVSLDWLEDSLLQPSRRPLDTVNYEFEPRSFNKKYRRRNTAKANVSPMSPDVVGDEIKKSSRSKKVENAGHNFDKVCQKFEKDMETAAFHPYADSTNFVYMINLVRGDVIKNTLEKHHLQLYESDSTPHTYACYSTYTSPTCSEEVSLAPNGSTWDFAWNIFKKFFEKRCGMEWRVRPPAKELHRFEASDDGNDFFEYCTSWKANRRDEKEDDQA